jgi:hypothetical protein
MMAAHAPTEILALADKISQRTALDNRQGAIRASAGHGLQAAGAAQAPPRRDNPD